MIIISQPKLEVRENEVLVSSCIEDDKKHFRETIFYKTSAAYGPYAVTEKADLFVLSALMPALFSQSDIRVEGTLSSDLKYTLENGLIYILAKTYGVRPIKVHAERIETFEFGGKAVGAGCSMGVDSLATIKQHYIDDNRYGHKITHLAIFNTCEFGFEDANEANKLFRYEYSRAAAFARETGLELLYVQSNVTSLLNRYGTGLYDTCTLVHAAAILFLEKLYAVYYHSSGYLLDQAQIYDTKSGTFRFHPVRHVFHPKYENILHPRNTRANRTHGIHHRRHSHKKIPARLYQDHRRRSRSQLRTLLQMPKDIGSDRHTREAPRIRNDLRSILLQNAQSRHLCEISRIPGGRSLFRGYPEFRKAKRVSNTEDGLFVECKILPIITGLYAGQRIAEPHQEKNQEILKNERIAEWE